MRDCCISGSLSLSAFVFAALSYACRFGGVTARCVLVARSCALCFRGVSIGLCLVGVGLESTHRRHCFPMAAYGVIWSPWSPQITPDGVEECIVTSHEYSSTLCCHRS